VAALALAQEDASELLLANLTADPVEISLEGWAGQARPSVMDSRAWDGSASPQGWEAARRLDPAASLRLEPFAIASLEQGPTLDRARPEGDAP
jgi:hypothetical protein